MPFILYLLLAIDICLYLYIGLTSNTVIASRSIQKIFSIMIYGDTHSLPSFSYYIIALLFIFIVLLLSLGDIKNLRKFTIAIMICRFTVIIIILSCCFYSMAEYGVSSLEQIPKFKIENISIMLGNSIFFFMIHHSIPGIVDSFKPQKQLTFLLFIGFFISLIFMISFGFIALLAFSKVTTCDNDYFPCAIQVFNL
jgi:purine-cytosine permease-like protein